MIEVVNKFGKIEIKALSSIDIIEVNNNIEIYKSGLSGGGGSGDSLWQSSGLDTIEPRFNKKVDTSSLVGTIEGGLFQP